MSDGFWETVKWLLTVATHPIWAVVLLVVIGIILTNHRIKEIRADRERNRSRADKTRDDA